jgi:hypothetical protein
MYRVLSTIAQALPLPYYCEGIAKLVHVMFLEYGGTFNSWHWRHLHKIHALRPIEHLMKAVGQLGVLHRVVIPCNMLWNVG